jgi:hypothetical protein
MVETVAQQELAAHAPNPTPQLVRSFAEEDKTAM